MEMYSSHNQMSDLTPKMMEQAALLPFYFFQTLAILALGLLSIVCFYTCCVTEEDYQRMNKRSDIFRHVEFVP